MGYSAKGNEKSREDASGQDDRVKFAVGKQGGPNPDGSYDGSSDVSSNCYAGNASGGKGHDGLQEEHDERNG